MQVTAAAPADLDSAVRCLVTAFADDPITRYLLQTGPAYPERLTQFFTLLMGARLALDVPVLVARGPAGIQGAVMGYATARPDWPQRLADDWQRFETADPGLSDRIARYDEIAQRCQPPAPHYYLGAIGTDPAVQGLGIGRQLLRSFCALSAADRLSSGVYLETAKPSNVGFYERAGFEITGRGKLGGASLWCMFLGHGRPTSIRSSLGT